MGCDVFANGREVSCKASGGKVVAAFPDVCLSPPAPPAGPIPIPYPVTSNASDTTDGTKTVTIKGQEVMRRDQSYFKQCTGDEAATRNFGMGVVTHTITGKVYFVAWSMDVEVEGQNVDRHLDVTTSNHASPPGNESVPWTELAEAAFAPGGKCEGMDDLKLIPFKDKCPESGEGDAQTPHHLIPGRCLLDTPNYNHRKAPCICVSFGNQHQGTHRDCHAVFDPVEWKHFDEGKSLTYKTARDTAALSAGGAVDRDLSAAEQDCVKVQLDAYYKTDPPAGPGCTDSTPLRTSGKPGKVLPKALAPPFAF